MDLRRFEDNWAGGLARFERRRDEFAQQFIAPLAEDMMMALLSSLEPNQIQTVDAAEPTLLDSISSKIGRGG